MARNGKHRLAVSRADNTIAVLVADDHGTWQEEYSGAGWWPTWRPGGNQLAVSQVTRTGQPAGRSVLQLVDLTSGGRLDVPGSSNAPARLIADRLAHYSLWSPDGGVLSYVSPAGRALASRVWGTGESAERTLMGGAPIFTTWSPDSKRIALHHGGSLTVIDAVTWSEVRISDSAAGFRTAAFLDDEHVVFAEPGAKGVQTYVASVADGKRVEGPAFTGGVAFSPIHGERKALVGTTPGDEAGVFSEIAIVDFANGTASPRFLKGPLMAFWWSPDRTRIAVLVPAYTGDGRFQIRFHRADGRFERAMEPTTLSQDTRTAVSFFDQYAYSHTPWSADGRYFAIGGRTLSDGPHASFSGTGLDSVLVADLENPGPWRVAACGLAGFFASEVNGR